MASEVKTLTVPVEAVVGEPEFVFAAYSATDLREIFVVGAAWPAIVRPIKTGEILYVHYAVRNRKAAGVAGVGTIEVKDLDTGAVVTTFTTPTLQPGEKFKTTGSGARVGAMPAKDWRLQFTVTP